MATNDVYINPGTEISFQSAGGTVVITVDVNTAADDGVQSDLCTLAAAYTTPRPEKFRWTCKCFWAAGAAVGDRFALFIAEADADGNIDGGVTAGDGAFIDEAALTNMKWIGNVLCTTATEEQEFASGVCTIRSNKFVLVCWNYGAATMHATATNFEFKILPIPLQPQA